MDVAEKIDLLFKTITNQMAIALENIEYIQQSNKMVKKLTETRLQQKYLKELEATNLALDDKNTQLQKLYDELKNKETQLIQSEKMASLGQLVAGISHELNNPIGFIYANIMQLKSYVLRIEDFLSQGEFEKRKDIEIIFPDIRNLIRDTIQGSQSVKQLVENLRRFSHLDQAAWKLSNVHEGIDNCLMILKQTFKDRILLHKHYKASGQIECNIGQLNQVFMNVLLNACQAIEGVGSIRISTLDEKDYIVIKFEDDGIGISENIREKIFDPFFTTKEVGQGVGLGLSITYSIIQNHAGSIMVNSEVGKGTTFLLKLPHKKKEMDDG